MMQKTRLKRLLCSNIRRKKSRRESLSTCMAVAWSSRQAKQTYVHLNEMLSKCMLVGCTYFAIDHHELRKCMTLLWAGCLKYLMIAEPSNGSAHNVAYTDAPCQHQGYEDKVVVSPHSQSLESSGKKSKYHSDSRQHSEDTAYSDEAGRPPEHRASVSSAAGMLLIACKVLSSGLQ